ncbi:phage tail length tape measure family protein [Burkholderia pseudomallei]|uniref:phage tail length tape measure family protein n=1 Tax=Burkholderia pseudomallei TaxID=28450 RepID=UPI0009B1DC40|nr:phage tail length tape measure family protein [Burkholderia pseudomallei]
MSDDNRVDVAITVTSDGAEQGASKAADSLTQAIGLIQQDLKELVTQSKATSAAISTGFSGMASAVEGMAGRIGSATQSVTTSVATTSNNTSQGAFRAAESISRAVGNIEKSLQELVSQSAHSSAAMVTGFAGMAAAIDGVSGRIGTAVRSTTRIVDDYGNEIGAVSRRVQQANTDEEESHKKLGHASVAARREMLVLGHEMLMGNYKRFVGSLMVLGEQMDWMGKIMSPTGAAIGLVAGALAVAASAAVHGAIQMSHLRDSLILTGNYAGLVGGQFVEMGNDIADATGSKITAARDALSAVAATGRFTGAALQPVAEAIAKIGQFSNASAEEVMKSFERMDDGVYKWAMEYNRSYHFANMAQLEHIRLLEEQGRKEEAEAETANLVIGKINETTAQLGYLPGLWRAVQIEASKAWDAMMNWGRPLNIDDKIAALKQNIASGGYITVEGVQVQGVDVEKAKSELRQLEQQRDQQRSAAQRAAQSADIQQKGAEAVRALRAEWKGLGGDAKLADDEIARFRRTIDQAKNAARDAGTPIPDDVQRMIAHQSQIETEIRKRYDSRDFKKAPGQVTVSHDYSFENAQTQARLNLLKENLKIETEELDRAYKQRQVSLQEYYQQRLAITLRGMDAERDAMRQQLEQTKQLETRAKTPAERLSMRTKEVEIEGRLAVMERQRAAAVTQSSQEMQAAISAETKGLEDLAAKRANIGFAQAQQRAMLVAREEVKQGRMTQAQLLELERQFEAQRTEVAIQAVQHRLDTEKTLTEVQQQELRDQKLQLEQEGQTKQLQLAIQANDAQSQNAKQAADSIEQDFSRAFANFADRTQTAKQAFVNFIAQIDQMLSQLVAKDLFGRLTKMDFGQGWSINSLLRSGTSKLFGGDAAGTTETTAHTIAVTADTTGITAMSAAVAAATAALTAFTASLAMGVAGKGMGGIAGAGGGLGSLFGEGTSGSNAWGFTMPDGSMGDVMPSIGGNAWGFTLPSFDVGTPYVPNDMIAQIHQGEAIVPAHMNSPYSAGGRVTVTNQFVLPNGVDLRTQSQIASMAGMAVQQALKRNA